ncbi:MAG: iron-regulated protein [Sedimenticola sp.]|jgi:uncharacterized iron-regulated protein|nr:MAG: iron-regulated protein [Sedimenticola sp.]
MMSGSMTTKRYALSALTAAALLLLWGCNAVSHKANQSPSAMHGHANGASEASPAGEQTMAVDLRNAYGLDTIIPALSEARVVFVGEQHDNYGHHLAQLEIIQRLHQIDPSIAIGMEMFQKPFQVHLDDFLAGVITEEEMLRRTEWYDRWRFDYRLYQPILSFAKQNGIPVIALNMQREITEKVSRLGIDGLSDEDKALIPAQIDKSDKAYEGRLDEIFKLHPNVEKKSFSHFIDSQLIWDETMAERAADYLQANPKHRLVVLAGSGHLMFGSGIPNRVVRRVPVNRAIVLPGDAQQVKPDVADFLIYPPGAELPKAGLMGLMMDPTDEGVKVAEVLAGKGAADAGLEKGDLIKAIDQQAIKTATDVRIHMQNKKPGDKVKVSVLRKKLLFAEKQLDFEIQLSD